jgi:NADPH2:quinone reductase
LYPVKTYPQTMGMEAVGIVDEVGEGVEHLKSGDRVAYCMVLGGYAERRVAPATKLVKVPDTIDDQTAAAMMLKGLTAHYLIRGRFSRARRRSRRVRHSTSSERGTSAGLSWAGGSSGSGCGRSSRTSQRTRGFIPNEPRAAFGYDAHRS